MSIEVKETQQLIWLPQEWTAAFSLEWFGAMGEALNYLPYIFPFAIATVIGGIDCAESAASAGDNYNTNTIIGIEAFSTLVAALCGGVIQSTPYIGHPAYKAMGGRAAYTLATALFIGGAGLIGYFSLINRIIPEAALMPILIFIGIEITAQSFHVTPKRHYAAIAVACLPALAKLVVIALESHGDFEKFNTDPEILNLRVLAGGFIITSLIWASAVAHMIDRRFSAASLYFAIGGVMVLFGVIHSPIDKMFLPTSLNNFTPEQFRIVTQYGLAYLLMAGIIFGYGAMMRKTNSVISTDEEFEAISG